MGTRTADGAGPTGARVVPQYITRHEVYYVMSERELDDLAHFNNVSTISMSFGSGLLSIAVAIGVAAAFQVEATRFGEILAFAVAPILALMAVGFLIFAEVERRRRQSLISSVKSG